VTALVVRLAHLWSMRDSPFFQVLLGDARAYDAWGQQIAQGDWLGHDVFYQAPLYAYFLGAIYSVHHSLLLVRICQAVIGSCACALLGYAAHRFFGRSAGLAAGLMLAIYAPVVFFDALVQKSVLDVFFLCLLLALLSAVVANLESAVPGRRFALRWFAAGLVLGALSLTRENALVFAPVVLAWIWLDSTFGARHPPSGARLPPSGARNPPSGARHPTSGARNPRVVATAMFAAGLALVLLPVGLRNRIVGGEFHLTTAQAGPNFFIGNNPHADGTYVPLRAGRGSPEYERQDASDLATRAAGRPLSPGEVSSYWTRRALEYIRMNPLNWLALEARKMRLLSNAAEVIDTESQESHEDYSLPLRLLSRVAHFGVLLPLACLGIWITWSERRRLSLLYAMGAVYAISLLVFYVVARYRLPLALFLILFAAAGLIRCRRFFKTLTPAGAFACAASLVGVAIFSNWPAVSAGEMRAVSYHNLGTALQERYASAADRADLREAESAFRRAIAFDPGYAPAQNGLGSVLREDGSLDEAIVHLREALRLRPDFDDANFNLANALVDQGRLPEAIARYEDLVRSHPDQVDIRSNLGIALANVGRLDEAIDQLRAAATLAPLAGRPHYNLGHALLTRGNSAEAVAELSRAVEIDPADVTAHYELANAYMAGERLSDAAAEYRETLRLAPESAEAHNDLGIVLGSMGKLNEAIEEFRLALRFDPSFREAQANLQKALGAGGK
jgi:tetratricopeptide (TPR) repeat protein